MHSWKKPVWGCKTRMTGMEFVLHEDVSKYTARATNELFRSKHIYEIEWSNGWTDNQCQKITNDGQLVKLIEAYPKDLQL